MRFPKPHDKSPGFANEFGMWCVCLAMCWLFWPLEDVLEVPLVVGAIFGLPYIAWRYFISPPDPD